jgi:hypothetical protein
MPVNERQPNNGVACCGPERVYCGAHTFNAERNGHTGEALITVWWEPDGTAAPHRRGTTG